VTSRGKKKDNLFKNELLLLFIWKRDFREEKLEAKKPHRKHLTVIQMEENEV
jgi:hypothetical protein